MAAYTRYRKYREADWKLWVLPESWNQELRHTVLQRVESLQPAKHPQTLEIRLRNTNARLFLKVFHRFSWLGTGKDFFRQSKALRSLSTGEALSGLGFNIPQAIAAGEQRTHGILRRSFLLTLPIAGTPLPVFLRDLYYSAGGNGRVLEKRDSLKRLALEIRRLHALGFIHGDLVPSNILISDVPGEGLGFFFLDNDRTRRYPKCFPQSLWKRNLIQLNRFPLAGISLQDRMRFFRFYMGRPKSFAQDRHLVRWLEKRTRQRRKECDAVDVSGSFRRLMRWDARILSQAQKNHDES
jgi:serine/threonine protein kinase